MTINDLIKKLEAIREEHGNLPVITDTIDSYGYEDWYGEAVVEYEFNDDLEKEIVYIHG